MLQTPLKLLQLTLIIVSYLLVIYINMYTCACMHTCTISICSAAEEYKELELEYDRFQLSFAVLYIAKFEVHKFRHLFLLIPRTRYVVTVHQLYNVLHKFFIHSQLATSCTYVAYVIIVQLHIVSLQVVHLLR